MTNNIVKECKQKKFEAEQQQGKQGFVVNPKRLIFSYLDMTDQIHSTETSISSSNSDSNMNHDQMKEIVAKENVMKRLGLQRTTPPWTIRAGGTALPRIASASMRFWWTNLVSRCRTTMLLPPSKQLTLTGVQKAGLHTKNKGVKGPHPAPTVSQ